MTLWFVFALMTAAAIFAVLWPLGRGERAAAATAARPPSTRINSPRSIATLAAGLIGAAEAEAARVEISRRLLAAADRERDPPPHRTSAGAARRRSWRLVGLPIIAVGVYLPLGSPRLGDFPLAQRARAPDATQSLDNLVAQVEAHLEKNPTDGRGWNVLAPVLARLGRYDEAVRAYRNSITYNGDSAERRADLGEALAGAAGGVVTSEAKAEFERAIALNADERQGELLPWARRRAGRPRRRGRVDLARRCSQRRRRTRPGVRWWRRRWRAWAAVAPLPAPSDDAMAAAKDMNEADRGAMIRGMVDRLASRLKQNGDDVEGWLRLVRAYMVMGDRRSSSHLLSLDFPAC